MEADDAYSDIELDYENKDIKREFEIISSPLIDDIDCGNEVIVTSEDKLNKNENNEIDISFLLDGLENGKSQEIKSKDRSVRSHNKIPEELKKIIVDSIDNGTCTRETAATTFKLPYPTVVNIYRTYLETGLTKRKSRTKFLSKKLQNEQINFLLDLLANDCTGTLKQLAEAVEKQFGIKVSLPTIAKNLPCFHFNLKRSQNATLAVITPFIIQNHKEYCKKILQFTSQKRNIIYFDQAEFHTTMKMFKGRQTVATSLASPSLRKRTKTIMAAMNRQKLLYYKVIEAPASSVSLLDHVIALLQILQKHHFGKSVLVFGDSLLSSQNYQINQMVEKAGYEQLLLPQFSPFLNPVEIMFSQWEKIIRSRNPTNLVELEGAMLTFNNLIGSTECENYCKDLTEIAISCTSDKFEYDK